MIDVYDFFSGCGGASKGFEQAGLNIRLGLDIDSAASLTYKKNFPNAFFLENDIRNISVSDLEPYIDRANELLFCGCAPCQPFSKQNQRKNANDSRINLLAEFSRFVEYFLPEYIFVENVPGIQKITNNDSPLRSFVCLLKEYGYDYIVDVVSASDYGVPQHRKRLILVANRVRKARFPEKTHGPGREHAYSTVRDWISGLPKLRAGETDKNDKDHTATKLSEENLKRILATPEGCGRESWPTDLRLNCHESHKGHTDVYGRLSFDQVSCTLTTRCVSYSNGRFGHPVENRAISIREAACLQTFPRDYSFEGSKGSRARQIGNAVPPLLAYHFGNVFRN